MEEKVPKLSDIRYQILEPYIQNTGAVFLEGQGKVKEFVKRIHVSEIETGETEVIRQKSKQTTKSTPKRKRIGKNKVVIHEHIYPFTARIQNEKIIVFISKEKWEPFDLIPFREQYFMQWKELNSPITVVWSNISFEYKKNWYYVFIQD